MSRQPQVPPTSGPVPSPATVHIDSWTEKATTHVGSRHSHTLGDTYGGQTAYQCVSVRTSIRPPSLSASQCSITGEYSGYTACARAGNGESAAGDG